MRVSGRLGTRQAPPPPKKLPAELGRPGRDHRDQTTAIVQVSLKVMDVGRNGVPVGVASHRQQPNMPGPELGTPIHLHVTRERKGAPYGRCNPQSPRRTTLTSSDTTTQHLTPSSSGISNQRLPPLVYMRLFAWVSTICEQRRYITAPPTVASARRTDWPRDSVLTPSSLRDLVDGPSAGPRQLDHVPLELLGVPDTHQNTCVPDPGIRSSRDVHKRAQTPFRSYPLKSIV